MKRSAFASVLLAFLISIPGCIRVNVEQPKPSGGEAAAPASAGAQEKPGKQEEEEESPYEDWEEVLEDTRPVEGYFDVHLKEDRRAYLEIPKDRLGTEFGMALYISKGVGDFNLQTGLPLSDARLMRLEKVGHRIHLVHVNPRFTASGASGYETALEKNVGHSVVQAFDIESENEETGAFLIDATGFFVSDYAGVSDRISFYYGDRPIRFDDGRSYVDRVLGFPENVEVDALLTFGSNDFPRFGGAGVSDPRSIPVGVRYSLFELPAEPMEPRYADDRVGHFLSAVWDFSRDQKEDPYVRMVDRWRLEKKDHSKEVSDPVEPIVYYVDRSVPDEYRKHVKAGIEAWQEAFEAAGISNAIVAKDPPADDTTWSAEDIRHSTVRWTTGYNMGYAIGPHEADPRTGEILNADVLISASFLRGWLSEYNTVVEARPIGFPGSGAGAGGASGSFFEIPDSWTGAPDASLRDALRPGTAPALRLLAADRILERMPPEMAGRVCLAEVGMAHQLGVQYATLLASGEIRAGEGLPEEYVGAAIKDLVMHEVGHTLNLRHNFKASGAIPHGRLNDESYTAEHGLTLSVMDYGPVNVSPDRSEQGHYWNPNVGSYDVWAIRYAYSPVYEQGSDGPFARTGTPVTGRDAQLRALDKIADDVADRMHTYQTDGERIAGVDPLTNAWDLGDDPLAFAADRARLVAQVKPELESRLIAPGEAYNRLRQGLQTMVFERYLSATPVVKYVGGLYQHRDHRGDPGGREPFAHVPAERQREAVRFLTGEFFAPGAFGFDAETLNRLAPSYWSHWGAPFVTIPVDWPVHSVVLAYQSSLLSQLLSPSRLARMVDNEVRTPAGMEPYTVDELMGTVHEAIWAELGDGSGPPEPITSFRRNLQRRYVDIVSELLLTQRIQVPEDARSLARYHLSELGGLIDAIEASSGDALDRLTRAHLQETAARIDRALEASATFEVN